MIKKYLKFSIYIFSAVFLLPIISIFILGRDSLTGGSSLAPVVSADISIGGDDNNSSDSYDYSYLGVYGGDGCDGGGADGGGGCDGDGDGS